jgi:hypothetical protein
MAWRRRGLSSVLRLCWRGAVAVRGRGRLVRRRLVWALGWLETPPLSWFLTEGNEPFAAVRGAWVVRRRPGAGGSGPKRGFAAVRVVSW